MQDAKAYAWLGSVDLSDNSDWTGVRLVRSSSVASVSGRIPSPLGPSPTLSLKVSAASTPADDSYGSRASFGAPSGDPPLVRAKQSLNRFAPMPLTASTSSSGPPDLPLRASDR